MASNTFIPRRNKHRNSALASAFHRGIVLSNHNKHYSSGCTSSVNFGPRFRNTDITARKLAAAFWQLRFMDVSNHAIASSILELSNNKETAAKDSLQNKPIAVLRSRNGLIRELVSPMHATLVGDSDSIVPMLVEELHEAQRSIVKLKAAQKSSEKRVEQYLENIEEEKLSWKHRQRQKIRATVDDLKDKLARETRSRMRMESLNEKLTQKLAEARSSSKQFMVRYEEEKKERELAEQVCNQLAMQIKEDRAKLEEKYNEIVHLIGCMKMFLESRGANSIESVNIGRTVINPLSPKQIASFDDELDKPNSPSSDHNSALKVAKFAKTVECMEDQDLINNVRKLRTSLPCSSRHIEKDFHSEVCFDDCYRRTLKEGRLRDGGGVSMKMNPHVTRGIKGCIEWPTGIPKATCKVIPLEERIRNQKSQIQNILKSKP